MGDLLPKRVQGVLCAAILGALCGRSAQAVTIVVDDSSDSPNATGCTVRGALTAVNAQAFLAVDACSTGAIGTFGDNDTVRFAPALRNSIISLSQGQLTLTGAVDLEGSGQTLDAGGNSPIAYVLSGYYQNYVPFPVHASNLTLTNASIPMGSAQGALTVTGPAVVQLDHVTLSNNTLHGGGGGAITVQQDATLSLSDCVVTGNTAFSYLTAAGGIDVDRATLRIAHSTISGNQVFATQPGSRIAGGIFANRGTLEIVDSTISANAVHGNVMLAGGGVLSRSSAITAVNTTFSENLVVGSDFLGGAMVLMAAYDQTGVTLLDTTISGNTASGGTTASGGILLYEEGYTFPLTVTNSIVAHNSGISADLALGNGFPAAQITAQSDLLGTAAQSIVNGPTLIFSDAPGLGALADNGGSTLTMLPGPSSPALGAGDAALAVYGAVSLLFDQRGDGFSRSSGVALDLGAVQTQGDRIRASGFEAGP